MVAQRRVTAEDGRGVGLVGDAGAAELIAALIRRSVEGDSVHELAAAVAAAVRQMDHQRCFDSPQDGADLRSRCTGLLCEAGEAEGSFTN